MKVLFKENQNILFKVRVMICFLHDLEMKSGLLENKLKYTLCKSKAKHIFRIFVSAK